MLIFVNESVFFMFTAACVVRFAERFKKKKKSIVNRRGIRIILTIRIMYILKNKTTTKKHYCLEYTFKIRPLFLRFECQNYFWCGFLKEKCHFIVFSKTRVPQNFDFTSYIPNLALYHTNKTY